MKLRTTLGRLVAGACAAAALAAAWPAAAGAASERIYSVAPVGTFTLPAGVAVAPDGAILVADAAADQVMRFSSDGLMTVFAGTGVGGFSGDGGQAIAAQLDTPAGLAIARDGSVLIADYGNSRVRRVSPGGVISTIAGTTRGSSGDGGPAVAAQLKSPALISVAADGSIVIPDEADHRVRRVGPDGRITTIAGTGMPGFSGDGGSGRLAQLDSPIGAAVTADGSVLISDQGNQRVRRLSPNGTISTFAGTGTAGSGGDGGPAAAAELSTPAGIEQAPDGTILIAEAAGHRIRRVAPDGTVSTLAGDGIAGTGGDGGLARFAELSRPLGIAVSPAGHVLVTDGQTGSLRAIEAGLVPATVVDRQVPGPAVTVPGPVIKVPVPVRGAPALATVTGRLRVSRRLAGRARVAFAATRAGALAVRVLRGSRTVLRTTGGRARAGANAARLPAGTGRLRPGRYVLALSVTSADGKSGTARVALDLRP